MCFPDTPTLRTPALLATLFVFAVLSLGTLHGLKLQPAGVDFAGMWGGAKAAVSNVGRLYDFHYVSELQNWPLGPGRLRPYAYPPSALLFLVPLSMVPWNVGYLIWTALTGAFFAWAGFRVGAPKWFVLIPWVASAAFCGQVTFLVGGLVMAALTLTEAPILAGVLFGLAAAVKPQLLMLLPLALIAEARWKTIVATGVTGLAIGAIAGLVWGLAPWFEWLNALPRFEHLVVSDTRGLVYNAITPYSALTYWNGEGSVALLLAPGADCWVWRTFHRGSDIADRLIALFGGAFLISPYAMSYELALFAPATAIYLARTRDSRWPGYVLAAIAQAFVIHPAFFNLALTLTLPLQKALSALPIFGRHPEVDAEPSLISRG